MHANNNISNKVASLLLTCEAGRQQGFHTNSTCFMLPALLICAVGFPASAKPCDSFKLRAHRVKAPSPAICFCHFLFSPLLLSLFQLSLSLSSICLLCHFPCCVQAKVEQRLQNTWRMVQKSNNNSLCVCSRFPDTNCLLLLFSPRNTNTYCHVSITSQDIILTYINVLEIYSKSNQHHYFFKPNKR